MNIPVIALLSFIVSCTGKQQTRVFVTPESFTVDTNSIPVDSASVGIIEHGEIKTPHQ
jgi:hypothetical protein